jgi:hypothetical protein
MPRRTHDFYETPPHYLDALGSVLEMPSDARTIEPCVGDGAISAWLHRVQGVPVLTTNDIDKTREADYHMDARNRRLYADDAYDWWITNPPFGVIDEILQTALTEVENVITLARLSILEPTEARREIYSYYQPDLLIVLPRYCFRLNDKGKRATDSVTCAWIGWGPQVPKITTVWTTPPPEGT